MDPIPTKTHTAEIAATVRDLQGGLLQFPLSKAINRIDDWRREILATEKPDLEPIADGLGELRESLVGEGVNGATVGPILVRLGEQTETAADGAAESMQDGLKRLGSLLRHAGSALTGEGTRDSDA